MRLLIVSHTPHHRRADGEIVGWGPTVREISALAGELGEVVHAAPLHPGPAPGSSEPYTGAAVRIRPLRPAGGAGPRAKLGILAALPGWAWAIREEVRRADAVHVRAPANVALVGLAVAAVSAGDRPVWVKYAGAWRPPPGTPVASRLQRGWVARNAAWRVTVNGGWDLPPHARSLPNPCLDRAEAAAALATAGRKAPPGPRTRILFVGRLEPEKGADVAVDAVRRLRAAGHDVRLDLAGDGSLRPLIEAEDPASIEVHGWLARGALFRLYEAAHFVLLPSRSEGWPKAIAEGMAHGAIPIASAVGSVPHYLARAGAGLALPLTAGAADYAAAVLARSADPGRWRKESLRAAAIGEEFTYEAYVRAVARMLGSGGRDAGPLDT